MTRGRAPFYRRRSVWRTAVPVILVAAAVAYAVSLIQFDPRHGSAHAKHAAKPVKLDAKATRAVHSLVREFVRTAVARKNLAESYRLTGPALREGISLERWEGGQVTVAPYPVDAKTTVVFAKPSRTHRNTLRYEVHVITPDKPKEAARVAGVFFVDVIKRDGRWLVNDWVPRWTAPIPNVSA
jgi:hypothetical protein